MLVRLERCDHGYIAYPVNSKIKNKIKNYLNKEWNIKSDGSHFFQSFEEVEECEMFPPKQLKELEKGWDIQCRVDDWTFCHLYGWDIHLLSERGELR